MVLIFLSLPDTGDRSKFQNFKQKKIGFLSSNSTCPSYSKMASGYVFLQELCYYQNTAYESLNTFTPVSIHSAFPSMVPAASEHHVGPTEATGVRVHDVLIGINGSIWGFGGHVPTIHHVSLSAVKKVAL